MSKKIILIIAIAVLVHSEFVDCFGREPQNNGYKLVLQKTTRLGGFLTKTFRTKGQNCREIPEGWTIMYRYHIRVDGKCISLYESNNCRGTPVVVAGQNVPRERVNIQEYAKKIQVHSFQECPPEQQAEGGRDNSGPSQDTKFPELGSRADIPNGNQNGQISSTITTTIEQQKPYQRPSNQYQYRKPTVSGLQPFKPNKNVEEVTRIILYSQPNFQGNKYMTKLQGCISIPLFLRNQVKSIFNPFKCVRLYTAYNCLGKSIQVQPDDDSRRDLSSLDFEDVVKSFGPCEEYQQLGLQLHNYYRSLHNSPPLKMVESLNTAAQLMADYLVTQPALPRPIGFISAELFYAVNNGPVDKLQLVRDAVASWYKENEFYDYNNPVSSRFTQLVWKNMQHFGIGVSTLYSNSTFHRSVVVANYFPRGNFEGQFQENVLPPVGQNSNNKQSLFNGR